MSPTDTVRQFMKLMEPQDYDAALKLVSDSCEYTNPPPFGTVHGPAAIRSNRYLCAVSGYFTRSTSSINIESGLTQTPYSP